MILGWSRPLTGTSLISMEEITEPSVMKALNNLITLVESTSSKKREDVESAVISFEAALEKHLDPFQFLVVRA